MLTLQTDYYLGASVPTGGIVTDRAFLQFLDTYVVCRFKGFTVTEGLGYWKGQNELVRVLSILHNGLDPDGIDRIGEAYRNVFAQTSVLIVKRAVEGRIV